jgi:multimeric flavodoxin WrbA
VNEIYPMWVAAHGIMIVTPVNWYQVSSRYFYQRLGKRTKKQIKALVPAGARSHAKKLLASTRHGTTQLKITSCQRVAWSG